MMYDFLSTLKQDVSLGGSATALKAPRLNVLHLALPHFQQQYISRLQQIVDALALTLAHRAKRGSHLDRLYVTECLTTKVSWEECMRRHEVQGVEEILVTVPCRCSSHD